MTIKELLITYKDVELTEEQEKHIKECLGIKESKNWRPEAREKYFYIDDWGDINFDPFEINNRSDEFRLFINNCFKTQEEADFRLEQIKVYNELKNFADENNGEIDWKKDFQIKCYIYYSYDNNVLDICNKFTSRNIGDIYFSSKELAQQAIEKVGANRIKKYLFEVE